MSISSVSVAVLLVPSPSTLAVPDHPRNVSDLVLEKLALNGGVLQVTFVPGFVSARPGGRSG